MTITATGKPRATVRTRIEAAAPGGTLLGFGALAMHMWHRQKLVSGKGIVHAGDPLHVYIRPSVPIAIAAGVLGAGLLYLAYSKLSEERAEAVRDASTIGLLGLGLTATGVYRVWDRGRIFRDNYPARAKLYELMGYGMNYATMGGLAGTAAGMLAPRQVLGVTRHVIPGGHDR